MIIIPVCLFSEGGKGNYFSGWDRLITGNLVRSVLIFKDQLHLNNMHLLSFSDP